MSAPNPYAPPRGEVRDIADPDGPAELAPRGTRLVAAILDGFIMFAMVYLPAVIVIIALSGADNAQELDPTAGIAGFATALVGLGVWAWLTIRSVLRNGQSIAKKWLGIKVTRTDGSAVGLGRIFWLRNVVNGVLGVIPLYGLIDVVLIFGNDRKCIHDMLADTVVVKA